MGTPTLSYSSTRSCATLCILVCPTVPKPPDIDSDADDDIDVPVERHPFLESEHYKALFQDYKKQLYGSKRHDLISELAASYAARLEAMLQLSIHPERSREKRMKSALELLLYPGCADKHQGVARAEAAAMTYHVLRQDHGLTKNKALDGLRQLGGYASAESAWQMVQKGRKARKARLR